MNMDIIDPMVGVGSLGLRGNEPCNSNSAGLIDLCSLCNRQFCSDGVLDSLGIAGLSQRPTKVEKIVNVFLADDGERDDERSLRLQLCPNCKNLCESLIRTKHTVSNLIDHITNLLLQNSRFTLINPKNVIVSELFSDFNPYSSSTTASLMLVGEYPAAESTLHPDPQAPSLEELDREIADLESQFHIDKLKDAHPREEESRSSTSSTYSSSCSLSSIPLMDSSSQSKDHHTSPTNIMNLSLVGNFGASIEILSRRQRDRPVQQTNSPGDNNLLNVITHEPDRELSFSNKLVQQKVLLAESTLDAAATSLISKLNRPIKAKSSACDITRASVMAKPKKIKPSGKPLLSVKKTFDCMLCPIVCRTKKDFGKHMGSHFQERKFICEVCGVGYRHKRGLEIHVALHNGEAEFKCEHCNKEFTQKAGLLRHLPIHTGLKAYQCEICGRRFLYETSYKAHVRTHSATTEKKKFPCSLCPQSFFSSYHLNRHAKRHLGCKPYRCEVCSKTFAEKWNLESHAKTHSVDFGKNFKCGSCNQSFDRKVKLEAHILEAHPS